MRRHTQEACRETSRTEFIWAFFSLLDAQKSDVHSRMCVCVCVCARESTLARSENGETSFAATWVLGNGSVDAFAVARRTREMGHC